MRYPALYVILTRVIHFNHLQYGNRCITQCSTSFRHASTISTACNTPTGVLPALCIIPMCDSHFNNLKYNYRFVAGSLSRSNPRLPFQLLASRRQVHYQLSTLFRRTSPIFTTCNTATGGLPALYIILMHDSYFNSLRYNYRFVADSLPCSNGHLPFQPLAIRRQVHYPAFCLVPTCVSHFNSLQYGDRCITQLSTLFRCASPISTACNTAPGTLPALCIMPIRDSHFNSLKYDYMFTASVNLSNIEYIELAIGIE